MVELSHRLYGMLTTSRSRQEVAGLFAERGWSTRKCSWDDYEVECLVAELVVESENPMLLHGPVADAVTVGAEVAAVLQAASIACSVEGYDETGKMIASFTQMKE